MTNFLRKVPKAIAAVAIVMVAAQIADAQPPGGGGGQGRRGGRGGGASYVAMAANPEVQALVKVTDDQKAKITAINEKLNTDRQEVMSGGFTETTQADVAKLSNDAGAKVAEALDATQNKNVLSVLVQAGGGPALMDAQLQKYLKITEEQKTKLAGIMPAGGGRGQRGATPEEQAAARVERDKAYTDILTAEQKTAWAELEKAQKVDDELLTTLRRGGGGGRGGFGGRGGDGAGGGRGRRGGGGAGGGAGGGN